ncbi:MAG: preprotein translocase subunit SecE [Candidatus Colwellbacteria bacterium CG_4_9_14_0_2_um_filter_50_12]|uniref:Protein translocase subunit SecE n=1 Tax=Candidatus Colwellbacteria bacterium CG_4_9_14_0_2_um_filter_50_12 TaxID=1974538 RepID=A0A2M8G1K1_9BACT|nr:MAG: preprotein translocase subunit SecE [Candidatus Colwellbacteria bacterium CG_4_9_14_0_2_um_filter_50_12]
MFERLTSFLKESRQEFQHVNWPTRRETIRMVLIVIGISLVVAAFLGALDYLFLYLLSLLVAS